MKLVAESLEDILKPKPKEEYFDAEKKVKIDFLDAIQNTKSNVDFLRQLNKDKTIDIEHLKQVYSDAVDYLWLLTENEQTQIENNSKFYRFVEGKIND